MFLGYIVHLFALQLSVYELLKFMFDPKEREGDLESGFLSNKMFLLSLIFVFNLLNYPGYFKKVISFLEGDNY
jgi:hypothetical protein